MIKHIVAWKLKESAHGLDKASNAKQIIEKLNALKATIPEIMALEVGSDFSHTETSADLVLVSVFENRAALEAYQIHPAHQAVAAFIREAVCERRLIDYEI